MAREIDDGWDTDDVSVTSTVAAPEGNYEVEAILAEKRGVWDDGQPDHPPFRGIKYLTKWDGYRLHESTWEPKSSFNPPDEHGNILPGTPIVLQHWYDMKKSMAAPEFRNYCKKHENEFVEAVKKAEAERSVKLAKREKKRQQPTAPNKRARPIVSDKDDEDEQTPSGRSQKRISPKPTAPPEVPRQGHDPVSARHPHRVRRPPIVQSESSLSGSDLTEDSMMEELDENKTTHNSTGARNFTQVNEPRPRSAQSTCSPSKRAATTASPKPPARLSQTETNSSKTRQTHSHSPTDTDPQTTKPQKDVAVTKRNRSPERADTDLLAPARQKSTADESTKSAASASSEQSVASNSQTDTNKATPSTGIKIVNQPKTQLRSQWKSGNSLFTTLHYRGLAQKRSSNEGTPDLEALEIMNDPSYNVKSKAQAVDQVPYNPNEYLHDLDEESTGAPLEPWEVDKVPLVCASWRLSSNCPRSAQNCLFLHRNKDPNGRYYPVGDPGGRIPRKFRKPPITCTHWLYGQKGCFKSDEQCDLAHHNTGWILNKGQPNGKLVPINQDLLPKTQKGHGPASQLPGVLRKKDVSPQERTCWYWANGKCRHTPEACQFQHYHTGIVAGRPLVKGIQQGSDSAVEQWDNLPLLATDVSVSEASCKRQRKRIHSVCELDFQDMFASNDSTGSTTLTDRRAFLVFHPEQHSEELELVTRWLLMHHVQIANSHCQGAWPVFQEQIKRGGSGVIIVHPDFDNFTKLSGLGQILRCQIRIWSVGLQEGIEYDPALSHTPPVYRYAPIEVFPVGGFIYITDEVLEREPQLALRIVELFLDKIVRLKQLEGPLSVGRQVDDASLLWRLCARPELMEYLMQYCEEHEEELEAGNADMQSRAQLYSLLAETKYIEQDNPSEPLSLVPDGFPILSERRIIADCEPVNYFKTLACNQEAANLSMIRYYAGLQVDLRRDYRHFFIVHTEPTATCVREWKQEIQTIAAVITPGKCVEELSKSSEASMFDFCERFMPEKLVKEGSDHEIFGGVA